MDTLCIVDAVDNGLIVRFTRVKRAKRQVHAASPIAMARLGGEIVRAIRGEGEDWKDQPEPAADAEPRTENVYVTEAAAIYCADDAAIVVALGEAKKAAAELALLGFNRSPFGQAMPAGIGLSQGFVAAQ